MPVCIVKENAHSKQDYNLTVLWKIHILVCHILPFVEHNNISLGNYAEQCGEAVYHKFKKTWVNYKRTIGHKNYAEKLKSAVVYVFFVSILDKY